MNGRPYTDEEKRIIAEMYADHFASEIAEKLGRPITGIYAIANRLGLKCSQEKRVRSGRMSSQHPNVKASQFKSGHVPANKGKKLKPEIYEKIKHTMFKKGQTPICYRPVGSERVNKDGYIEIKVADPGTWRLKHRVIWEEAYGPIPAGHNVQFRNGDKQDLRIDNLYLISRAEQMGKENSFHTRYPEELKAVIRLKGSIKRQITEHNKKRRKDGK